MEIVKLRGYTSPSEMKGTETEKMQKSIDGVIKHDERKVVVKESIAVEETIRLCGPLEIVFEDGVTVRMNGEKPLFTNDPAEENAPGEEDERIYLKGDGKAVLKGDLEFYHANHVVLEDLVIEGRVGFEYCRNVRMERVTVRSEGDGIVLRRGCSGFILQYLTVEAGKEAVKCGEDLSRGPEIPGQGRGISSVILHDSALNET